MELFYVPIYLNRALFAYEAKGSIIGAFYGIGWGHHVNGFISLTDNSFVRLAFKGCQRLSKK